MLAVCSEPSFLPVTIEQRGNLFVTREFASTRLRHAFFDRGTFVVREHIDLGTRSFHLEKYAHRLLLPFRRPALHAIQNRVDFRFGHLWNIARAPARVIARP